VVREHAAYTPGGRLTDLRLEAGGVTDQIRYEYDSAARVRRVRDGAGPTIYDLQVHVLAEPAADDAPTRVRRRGAWLADDLLETSDRIA
jgi:hypothetical protein